MVFRKRVGKFYQTEEVTARHPEIVNRFDELKKRLKSSEFYEDDLTEEAPLGYFDGRAIIGESTPINGGVYLGAIPHEAIVVDDTSGELDSVYTQMMVLFAKDYGMTKKLEGKILPYVLEVVQYRLPIRPEGVRQALITAGIQPDSKVSIDLFLQREAACPRHQCLLAAYLIEKLITKGYLSGLYQLSTDFSYEEQTPESLVYIAPNGEKTLINPVRFRSGEGLRLVA